MKLYLRFLLPSIASIALFNTSIDTTMQMDLSANHYQKPNEVVEMYNIREKDTLTDEISIIRENVIEFYQNNPKKIVREEQKEVGQSENTEVDQSDIEKNEDAVESQQNQQQPVVQEQTYKEQVIAPNPNMDLATQVVSFAVQFEGNPYVYGGTSLTNGADCSGFVQSVFANFGISLPRGARDQANVGNYVDVGNMQPGDIVLYGYNGSVTHAAIYIGNGQVIHALNPQQGIAITTAQLMPIISVRRVL